VEVFVVVDLRDAPGDAATFEAPWMLVAGRPLDVIAGALTRALPISLAGAVARVTTQAASALGFARRQCVAVGCAADLVILDTTAVTSGRPAIRAALLSGVPTIQDGARTTAGPGRLLTRPVSARP
jgi:N-acyl-D-aspartate/D-glutamate deacylase